MANSLYNVKLRDPVTNRVYFGAQVSSATDGAAITAAAAANPGATVEWVASVGDHQPLQGNDGLGHDAVGAAFVTQ